MPCCSTDVSATIPAIPHMLAMLQSRGAGRGAGYDSFEQLFVALRAAFNEIVFHLGEVVFADRRPPLGGVAQRTDRIVERLQVVQLNDVAGVWCREEVGLAAPVVADDGQSERHRLEEYQAE